MFLFLGFWPWKRCERVTQPIITAKCWEQYWKLIHDSIDNDSYLRFTTYTGGSKHHLLSKCYLMSH